MSVVLNRLLNGEVNKCSQRHSEEKQPPDACLARASPAPGALISGCSPARVLLPARLHGECLSLALSWVLWTTLLGPHTARPPVSAPGPGPCRQLGLQAARAAFVGWSQCSSFLFAERPCDRPEPRPRPWCRPRPPHDCSLPGPQGCHPSVPWSLRRPRRSGCSVGGEKTCRPRSKAGRPRAGDAVNTALSPPLGHTETHRRGL